jgi:hypothetical protein
MLLAAAAAAQKKTEQSFAVVWAEGGRQAALEQAAGVGEFDYPALAVVGAKKKVSGFGLALALPWLWLGLALALTFGLARLGAPGAGEDGRRLREALRRRLPRAPRPRPGVGSAEYPIAAPAIVTPGSESQCC